MTCTKPASMAILSNVLMGSFVSLSLPFGVSALQCGLRQLTVASSPRPTHRGQLTVGQFNAAFIVSFSYFYSRWPRFRRSCCNSCISGLTFFILILLATVPSKLIKLLYLLKCPTVNSPILLRWHPCLFNLPSTLTLAGEKLAVDFFTFLVAQNKHKRWRLA